MALPTAMTNRMWPFFHVWLKGKDVKTWMEFKRLAPRLTNDEFRDVYRRSQSLASGRVTDTNRQALAHVCASIRKDSRSLIDIGCGGGYFLRELQQSARWGNINLYGCDMMDRGEIGSATYVVGDLESLPFADRSIDVVTCFHTLEHTRRLDLAVAELKRICRRQLIIVVPKQRYFHYTLDLHLNFFPEAEALESVVRLGRPIVEFGSDLVYIADL